MWPTPSIPIWRTKCTIARASNPHLPLHPWKYTRAEAWKCTIGIHLERLSNCPMCLGDARKLTGWIILWLGCYCACGWRCSWSLQSYRGSWWRMNKIPIRPFPLPRGYSREFLSLMWNAVLLSLRYVISMKYSYIWNTIQPLWGMKTPWVIDKTREILKWCHMLLKSVQNGSLWHVFLLCKFVTT